MTDSSLVVILHNNITWRNIIGTQYRWMHGYESRMHWQMSMPPSKTDDPCGGENICTPFCTVCLFKLFWWNSYMMLKNQYHFSVVMSKLHHLKPWKTGRINFCVKCIDTRVGCETCIDTQSKMHWPSRWRQALPCSLYGETPKYWTIIGTLHNIS